MSKVFKPFSEGPPRNLAEYERGVLEDLDAGASEEEDVITREMIIEEARREAEEKVREAYAEGLRRGTAAGEARFRESVAEAAEALKTAAEAMRESRDRFLDSLEPQVVDLALAIAERVLARESLTDRELVRSTARRALTELSSRESVVVRVNPVDLEVMRNHKVNLLEEFGEIQSLIVQADESIGPGGCLVETDQMQVDARLDAQLKTIMDALHEAGLGENGA